MESPLQFKHILPVQLRFSDVDQFGHVNNSVYFSLYDLAKTTYIHDVMGRLLDLEKEAIVVANVSANFVSPIYYSDNVAIETTVVHFGTTSFRLEQQAVDVNTHNVKCTCTTVMVYYDLKSQEPMPISDEFKMAVCKYEGHPID